MADRQFVWCWMLRVIAFYSAEPAVDRRVLDGHAPYTVHQHTGAN